MIDREFASRFDVDCAHGTYVRDYIEGEFGQDLRARWIESEVAVLLCLPEGWRVLPAVKVARDGHGREIRFPVLLVESEDIP